MVEDEHTHDDPAARTGSGYRAARQIFAAIRADEPDTVPADDLPTIEGYMLHRRLGGGGGGAVYLASAAASTTSAAAAAASGREAGAPHDRPLALKILSLRFGRTTAVARAWRELELLRQLHLPCLPRLIDYGESDGRLFLATEFVDGPTLDHHCDVARLDLRRRVERLAAVARAVQSLHEHGVIHRDLKPSNVLINEHGEPILIDLGIATLAADHAMETLTAEGAPIGSPAFMAPEQARGERAAISTRTDVYGLGAMGYVLLTGEPPHDPNETLHAMLRRIASEPAREPRSLRRDLPRPLAAVLGKAVAHSPSNRYPSAAAFADDLGRWLAGEPVEAGPPSVAQRLARFVARHPVATSAAASITIAAIVLLSSIASIWWVNLRPSHLEWDGDEYRAALLRSVGGAILHTWHAGRGQRIFDATEVAVGERVAGERVVALARHRSGITLEAYALTHPPRLLWTDEHDRPAARMPVPISMVAPSVFRCNRLVAADVFPAVEGEELIAMYWHIGHSPTCLRIYDAATGTVLYEAWHDGSLHQAYWSAEHGLLVVAGINSEAPLSALGVDHTSSRNIHPLVVFALRPELGVRHTRWITPREHHPRSMRAAWYRCVLPLDAYDRFGHDHIRFTVGYCAPWTGGCAQVALHVGDMRHIATLDIDAHGGLIEHETLDERRLVRGGTDGPPIALTLGDLPPIDADRREMVRRQIAEAWLQDGEDEKATAGDRR